MSVYAVIGATGLVVNRIVLDEPSGFALDDGLKLVLEGDRSFDIGGVIAGDRYSPPSYPEPIATPSPTTISDRQFFQQLETLGIISRADALDAVRTGTIPAPMQVFIDALPSDQQFGAAMIVSGATSFERNHPLTIAIGTGYGWNADQIDSFFRAAAAL